MLDRINNIEKILSLSLSEIKHIISESYRPLPGIGGYFDYNSYLRDLEEGQISLAFQVFAIERRLATHHNQIQDPPRPVHVPRSKVICREHRKLRRCLRIFMTEIDERHEYLQFARENGGHQGIH